MKKSLAITKVSVVLFALSMLILFLFNKMLSENIHGLLIIIAVVTMHSSVAGWIFCLKLHDEQQ